MTTALNEDILDPMSPSDLQWVDVCDETDLQVNRGVCALVSGVAVAIFLVHLADEASALFAVSNIDPFTDASVLSRGIVGSVGDTIKVTSPLLKHAFNLATGESLDDPSVCVQTFAVRVRDGRVHLALRDA